MGIAIMDIIIRPARPEDIPVLCDLLEDLFTIESDFAPDVEKQVKGLSLLVTDPSESSLVLVAVAHGEVVGMGTVQTLVSTAEGGRVGLVEDVIVKKEYRGLGIATRLLDEIRAWSAAKHLSRLQLLADIENKKALNFYFRRNWSMTNLVCLRAVLKGRR